MFSYRFHRKRQTFFLTFQLTCQAILGKAKYHKIVKKEKIPKHHSGENQITLAFRDEDGPSPLATLRKEIKNHLFEQYHPPCLNKVFRN